MPGELSFEDWMKAGQPKTQAGYERTKLAAARARVRSGEVPGRRELREEKKEAAAREKAEALFEKKLEKVEKRARGIAQTGIKAVEAVGVSVLKGVGHLARIKGVRPQDEWINPKTIPMYLPQNPQVTPLGYKPTVHELFFGGRDRLSTIHGAPGAREKIGEFGDYQATLRARLYGEQIPGAPYGTEEVYDKYQRGANVDELEVETGLTPQQIVPCLRYLIERGKIPKDYLE